MPMPRYVEPQKTYTSPKATMIFHRLADAAVLMGGVGKIQNIRVREGIG
jgi:hypothetical protein